MLFRLAGMGLKAAMPHLGKIGSVANTGLALGGLGYGINEIASAPGKVEKRLIKDGPDEFGEYKLQGLENLLAPFVKEEDTKGLNNKRANYLNENNEQILQRTGKGVRGINPGEKISSYLSGTNSDYQQAVGREKLALADIGFNSAQNQYERQRAEQRQKAQAAQIAFQNAESQRQFDQNVALARQSAADKLEMQRQQLGLDRLNLTSRIERDKYNREQDRRDRRQALIASILGLAI